MYNLENLTGIWLAMANDHRYRKYTDNGEFCENVVRGVIAEGLDFLTKRLPEEGKLFERYLSTGEWPRWGGILPSCLIADLRDPSPVAVDCVRQLTQLYYKLEVTHDEGLVDEFLRRFRTVDAELALHPWGDSFSHRCDMRDLIGLVLSKTDPKSINPKHGKGATSCKTKSFDKYHRIRWFPELDAVYSYDSHFYLNLEHLLDEQSDWEDGWDKELEECGLKRTREDTYSLRAREWEVGVPEARICLVPKDSRGPRVISCEPAEHMYIQQGLMRLLYRHLESHYLTRGNINFLDQSINQNLARLGSITGRLATIDMKDASDRVSTFLVKDLFPSEWVECLMACRSTTTRLPDDSVVTMQKFAPMGSSVCFPVEALVFWASAIATQRRLGVKRPFAVVYGDDIIVPAYLAPSVMEDLETLALKVNFHKSYLSGHFRESCGGDYYKGVDVTPVRLKKCFDSSVLGLTKGADFANLVLAKFGDVESFRRILDLIESECNYTYPCSELSMPNTVRLSARASNDVRFRRRWNNQFQRFEHLILVPRVEAERLRDPGWVELLRWQLERAESRPTAVSCLPEPREERDTYSGDWILESVQGERLKPGWYADPRRIRRAWTWAWLG